MNAKDAIYSCDDFDANPKRRRRRDEPKITHTQKRQKDDDILQRQGENVSTREVVIKLGRPLQGCLMQSSK